MQSNRAQLTSKQSENKLLRWWQWGVLVAPMLAAIALIGVAAGWQIHTWRLNWIWAVFVVVFLGWRWLLVQWTRPAEEATHWGEETLAALEQELEASVAVGVAGDAETARQAEAQLQTILQAAREDLPFWLDWTTFWQRCQDLVTAIAQIYHPEAKYPLLNIYVTQAYGLVRGTVDDLDRWIEQLSPVLNRVTVGQVYRGYELYQQLEPAARRLRQVLNVAQWLLNPAAALARWLGRNSTDRANEQLAANLSQVLREAALRNLYRQAIALYSGSSAIQPVEIAPPSPSQDTDTQTLQAILEAAEPVEAIAQKPVNLLLVGRTGAGKSSLVNSVFQAERAVVDLLPSTEATRSYRWQADSGETLLLWDSPGYEQVERDDLRQLVLEFARQVDAVVLVTPALDPSLQMDIDLLKEIRAEIPDLPAIVAVTQVDRLRPLREWSPPYDWQLGDRPKELNIKGAIDYRAELLGEFCTLLLPVVNGDRTVGRESWGIDALSLALLQTLEPAKQSRMARFLRDRDARIVAAAQIIDRYTFQMSTSQGLTELLKSPVLQFVSTLATGSTALAVALAQKIPVEQLPVMLGKLQMAYELFALLDNSGDRPFDLLVLWPLLTNNSTTADRNAWAFGHTVVEYWTQTIDREPLEQRFHYYLQQTGSI
ncbi:GTPase family protein [Synechococcus sp. PCC 7336]|uniref:GTPase family protein n=1 Tax=Synechococcus sp. PCC 7336 TaxID=195250 RepID=UPI0003493768|nr:GTPase [Synechococcus sp. PCC 7336]